MPSFTNLRRKAIAPTNVVMPLVAAMLIIAAPMAATTGIAYADTNCSPNGIQYSGSSWLSSGGVNICNHPGDDSAVYVNNINGQSTLSGYKWECVEMVNRLYLTKGWTTSTWSGNGNTLVNNVPGDLTEEDNNHISYVNAGDVITLDDGGFGHAAIINTISGSTVNIINQNAQQLNSSASITSGSLSSGNAHYDMSGWAGYNVQAFVHHEGTATGTEVLWGVNSSGQAVRYAGSAVWTTQGGPTFQDITANASYVAGVSTSGGAYTYQGSNTWHQVSGATLTDIAVTDTDVLWGVNTSGQAVRYAGSGVWTSQGGPTFQDIASDGQYVAGVSTSGGAYTYQGSNTWHQVSGATLTDIGIVVQ